MLFSARISRFACDLTALCKFEQLRTNEVETRLGVTGAFHTTKIIVLLSLFET